jgi:hypothetical protein
MNWLKENWFKISIIILACGALVMWHIQIKSQRAASDYRAKMLEPYPPSGTRERIRF